MSRILIGGTATIDFVFRLDRMPEAAEKYRADAMQAVGGGGAANAAVAVSRLGGQAILTSRIGRDTIGDMIVAGLRREGVDCTLVRRFEDGTSPLSSVYVDSSGNRQIVNFRGDKLPTDADRLAESAPAFDAVLADTRWTEGGQTLLRLARERGVPSVIDGEAPVPDVLVRNASHVAFSLQGLRDYAGTADPVQGLTRTRARTDAWLCVTDGANGIWFTEGGAISHVPAFAVDVVDTLGAGDVWHGAFVLRLAEGADERTALVFASAAAALKCTAFGGRKATPTRETTDKFLQENPL